MTPTITAHHVNIARRVTVAFIAYVYVCAVLLTNCVYDLGYQTGAAIHWRNNQLAAAFATLTTGGTSVMPAVAPVVIPEPEPVVMPTAPELVVTPTAAPVVMPTASSLTVRELRSLTGAKSKKLKKADLITIAVDMGIAA